MRRASLLTLLVLVGCKHAPSSSARPAPRDDQRAVASSSNAPPADAGEDVVKEIAAVDAAPSLRDPGPYDIPFDGPRTVFVIAPRSTEKPQRLIAFLHGICNPPEYACGLWQQTATELGFVVCPNGDARCGPAQSNAPTWGKPESAIDADLEKAIAATMERFDGELTRDDAVLCGFSRGAYMAVKFAVAHPGRWPYLVLNEASVSLDVAQLKAAKVRAVALIAGEIGGQIGSERKTVAKLVAQGYPAKFWPMPKAGHWYSDDIAEIMREAIEFVTSHKE